MCDQKFTVYKLLNHYKIRIPKIQRDYAQGRKDKGYIRESFLTDISKVIKSTEEQELSLDYIYGYFDDKYFIPLDGQQRLTTIWLVYWFLAVQSGTIKDDKVQETLKNFTYETRASSRDFCNCLRTKHFDPFKFDVSVVDYMENQNWFWAEWKMDPTISSMLRTISGEGKSDGIVPIFNSKEEIARDQWKDYLINLEKRIYFYLREINEDQLPVEKASQLYIKINARGKALSDFENLRADLINDLSHQGNKIGDDSIDMYFSHKIDGSWGDLFWNEVNRFNMSLEEITNDEKQTENNKNAKMFLEDEIGLNPDDYFFAFINRFCFGKLCVAKDQIGKTDGNKSDDYRLKSSYISIIDDIIDPEADIEALPEEKQRKIAEIRKDDNANLRDCLIQYDYFRDRKSSYENYRMYKDVLTESAILDLQKVFDGLCKTAKSGLKWGNIVCDCLNEIANSAIKIRLPDASAYRFFPYYSRIKEYSENKIDYVLGNIEHIKNKGGVIVGVVEDIRFKDRLYFFSICKYLEKNYESSYDINKFKDWLYFCRNVIENAGISSASAMITCMRKLDQFGNHSGSILDYLASDACKNELYKDKLYDKKKNAFFDGKDELESQIFEEILKAEAIKKNYVSKLSVRTAENYSCFCGCIRFLFVDKNKNVDWMNFNLRYLLVNRYFVKDRNIVNYGFVDSFAKSFENFEKVQAKLIFHTVGWAERGDSWLDILRSFICTDKVDCILLTGSLPEKYKSNKEYMDFIDSAAFKKIVTKPIQNRWPDWSNLWIVKKSEIWTCSKKNSENNMLALSGVRNQRLLILSNKGFEINNVNVNEEDINNPYYWYRDIKLSKNGRLFLYSIEDKIMEYNVNNNKFDIERQFDYLENL